MEISSRKSSFLFVSSPNLNHFAPSRKNHPSLLINQHVQLSILTKLFYKSLFFLRFVGLNPLKVIKVSDEGSYQNHSQSSAAVSHYEFYLKWLSWPPLFSFLIKVAYLSGACLMNFLLISGRAKMSSFMTVTGGDG